MVEIKICIGSACHLKGSYSVLTNLQQLIEEYNVHDKVALRSQFCMGNCQNGVSVGIGDTVYSVSPETTREFFKENVLPLIK